jgi:hypothetical protein
MAVEHSELNEMSDDLIRKAMDLARSRVVQAEQDRAALDRVIAASREEERLLSRLLALRKGEILPESKVESDDNGRPAQPTSGLPSTERTGAVSRHGVVEAVIQELVQAGRPIHISDLMRLLRSHSISIPGSGAQANLITHLRRDARLMRPSRGMYGLTEWGLEEMQATVRRRRKRRVSSKRSHKGPNT